MNHGMNMNKWGDYFSDLKQQTVEIYVEACWFEKCLIRDFEACLQGWWIKWGWWIIVIFPNYVKHNAEHFVYVYVDTV